MRAQVMAAVRDCLLHAMLWRILLVPMLSNEIVWIGSHWRKRPDAKKKHIWNVKKNTKARTVVAATCMQIREYCVILYNYGYIRTYLKIYTYFRMSQVSPSLDLLSCALIPASLAAESSWSPFCQLQLMLAALKEAAEGWICMPHKGKLEKVKTEWEKMCQQTTRWMDSEYLCPCSSTKVLNKGSLRSQSFTRKRWDNNIWVGQVH